MQGHGHATINIRKLTFIKWISIAVFFSLLVIANLRAAERSLVKIPFNIDENYPILTVYLNNSSTPIHMLFDTGLTGISLALPEKTVNALNVQKTGKEMVGNTTFTHEPIEFDALDVKAFRSGELQASQIDKAYQMSEIWGYCDNKNCEHDGVIGLHFFRQLNYNIFVDYTNKEMTLVPYGSQSDAFRNATYIQSIDPLHFVGEYDFNGTKVNLTWDTGASQSFIQKAGLLSDKFSVDIAPGMSALRLPIKANNATFDIDFENTKDHIKHNVVRGFVGFNFFEQHKVFFDLENQRLYIQ